MDAVQRTRRLVGHCTRRYTFQSTLPPRLSDDILGVEEGSGGMGSGGMTRPGHGLVHIGPERDRAHNPRISEGSFGSGPK